MIDKRWRLARKILAVRPDNLGDVLVTTPAIHAIKASLPDASITLLASPVGAQVGKLNPDIYHVIVYEAPWMDPWHKLPQNSQREQQMIALIRERQFDAAIIFTSFRQSSLPAAYLCYLADIPLRAAASIDGPGSLLTTRHKHPERMMHEVERGLDLVGALGLETHDLDLVLKVPDEARSHIADLLSAYSIRGIYSLPDTGGELPLKGERNDATSVGATFMAPQGRGRATVPEFATSILQGDIHERADGGIGAINRPLRVIRKDVEPVGGDRPLIVVHPGCSMPARTYPWEMYSEVVDLLVERLGAMVILTGAKDEQALVEQVLSQVQEQNRSSTLGLAGALSFPEFCALIETADLTLTNNTGPMHISAAVKTPVVALFALTNPPEQWGPWHVPHRQLYHDVSCRICYNRICPYGHECLRLVTPPMVVDAANELLLETDKGLTVRRGGGGAVLGGGPRARPWEGKGDSPQGTRKGPRSSSAPPLPLQVICKSKGANA